MQNELQTNSSRKSALALGRPRADRRRRGRRLSPGPTGQTTTGPRHPGSEIGQRAGKKASLVGQGTTTTTSYDTPHRRHHQPSSQNTQACQDPTTDYRPTYGDDTATATSRTYRPAARAGNHARVNRRNTALRGTRRTPISRPNRHRYLEPPVYRRRPPPFLTVPAMANRRRTTTAG